MDNIAELSAVELLDLNRDLHGSRAIRLLAMPDGDYVMAGGLVPGTAVHFSQDGSGLRWLEIQGFETVRWSSGPA